VCGGEVCEMTAEAVYISRGNVMLPNDQRSGLNSAELGGVCLRGPECGHTWDGEPTRREWRGNERAVWGSTLAPSRKSSKGTIQHDFPSKSAIGSHRGKDLLGDADTDVAKGKAERCRPPFQYVLFRRLLMLTRTWLRMRLVADGNR